MEMLNKVVFDHSVITSEFLNTLQDFVIARSPKLVPFDESDETVPTTEATKSLSIQNILFGSAGVSGPFEPVVEDILVGVPSGYLAVVLEDDGQSMTVRGLGKKIGT